MKKISLLFLFAFIALCGYSQIYTSKILYDKFDDIIKEETKKTLVTKTDSTFIIEEKGKKPIVYFILNIIEGATEGSKDDIVNLVDNVYGYQTSWCVIRYDLLDKYKEVYSKYVLDPSDENMKAMGKFWIFATHRTITTQYTGTYKNELFWLSDELNDGKLGPDVSRIIYRK